MKSFVFITLFVVFALHAKSQVTVQHSIGIKHILTDSLSNIYLLDENNSLLRLNDNTITSFSSEYKRIVFKPSLKRNNQAIIDGQLKEINNNQLKLLADNASYLYKKNNISIQYNNKSIVSQTNSTNCNYNFTNSVLDAIYLGEKPFVLANDSLIDICGNSIFSLPFYATSFTALNDDELLISSKENALWLYKNNRIKKYYTQGVHFPDEIKLIKKIRNTVWILTFDKTLFNYNLDQQLLKRVAVNVEDFVLDYWDKLYYATGNSITSNINFINKNLPLLSIINIDVNNERINVSNSINLNEGDQIKLEYHVNYSPNNKLDVLYKLSNETKWQKSNQSPIVIDNINSQVNNIELKTSHNGDHFTRPIKFDIETKKSFWGSLLSYVIIGLGLLLVLIFVSYLRMSRQNKLLEVEKRALKLELEITKKEQKLGQLQLNPHFIFNTMNSINGLIALDKKALARKALSKFASIMRTVLSFSFDERIETEEELNFLNDYIQLEQLIRENKFEYNIVSEIRNLEIPPMVIQPFVENAIIHGLQHKKENGQLNILLEENNKYIKVVVEDNGIGRVAAKRYRKETHNSSAIKIVEERIGKLDKWKDEKPITYIDLYNDNEVALGTKCILQIPK